MSIINDRVIPGLVGKLHLMEFACVLSAVSSLVEAAPKADLYIAENGNDTWSGRLAAPNSAGTDGPLASLRAARSAIRKMKKTSDLTKPVTVLLRGGTYRMLKPVEFLPIDSGSKNAPITYEADPDFLEHARREVFQQ